MAVAAELPAVSPDLDEVRALAQEHTLVPLRHSFIDDCETPVSAFLKLREGGQAFLLESADQGQPLKLSINVPLSTLQSPSFVDLIRSALPKKLCTEPHRCGNESR